MNATLNINDFRLPEEVEYAEAFKSNPGIKKLEKKSPQIVPEAQSDKSQLLNRLNKHGVKITKSTSSEIIGNLENSFLLFGQKIPKYDVFAIKNLGAEIFPELSEEPIKDENAMVLQDNEIVIILFVHNILNTMTEEEIKSVIGHEIGHFLLGHGLVNIAVGALDAMEESEIMRSNDLVDLFVSGHLLVQLQELSADRIGLIVSQDLESTISALAKFTGGLIREKLSVQDYIKQAMEAPLEPDDFRELHPYHPHRSWALAEFYESDAFQEKILGKEGGKPLSEFSKLLPRIIPLPVEANSKSTLSLEDKPWGVDDYLLEELLCGTIAWADNKYTPAEHKTITKFVPLAMREEIFRRMDEINSKTGKELDKIIDEAYKKAAQKDTRWKAKVVKRMIKVIKADRRVSKSELSWLAKIVGAIDARSECRKQCLKEFGYDPFA